jgi:hypothetical protein
MHQKVDGLPNIFREAGLAPKVEVIHKTFCSREKDAIMTKILNVDTALYHMLNFATETAQLNAEVRLGMLDAGSLALVLTAFASADFRLSGLTVMPWKDGKAKTNNTGGKRYWDAAASPYHSSPAINAEASTLCICIHNDRFRKSWPRRQFDTRLSLCSSLVYSLLGRDEVVNDEYEVTRGLFRKIITREYLLE